MSDSLCNLAHPLLQQTRQSIALPPEIDEDSNIPRSTSTFSFQTALRDAIQNRREKASNCNRGVTESQLNRARRNTPLSLRTPSRDAARVRYLSGHARDR